MRLNRRTISARRGTTLIEVLAGLVVLATLLAAVSVARGRFLRQWADADAKLRATRAADVLMAAWVAGDSINVPLNAGGPLDNAAGCTWQTHVLPEPGAGKLGAVLVRLEVFHNARVLFNVDLLTPKPKPRVAP